MWWGKKKPETPLVPHRDEMNAMASALPKISGIDFDTPQLE